MFVDNESIFEVTIVTDKGTLEECNTLMERVRECRHNRVMKRQKAKIVALI